MEISITNGIKICVETFYLADESAPSKSNYSHAYRITIENHSPGTVQLLRRQWNIIDSNGVKRMVEGEGVIGKQPILAPGASHKYTSWCPLMTDIGKMYGTYLMKRYPNGKNFEVSIPAFNLIPPFKLN